MENREKIIVLQRETKEKKIREEEEGPKMISEERNKLTKERIPTKKGERIENFLKVRVKWVE